MYTVFELEQLVIPDDGMRCSVKGKFNYRISDHKDQGASGYNCYLEDSSGSGSPRLFLADKVGEKVIHEDEIFGMMVGGDFAYYDLDAVLEGIIKRAPEGMVCEIIDSLILERDGESQAFRFHI